MLNFRPFVIPRYPIYFYNIIIRTMYMYIIYVYTNALLKYVWTTLTSCTEKCIQHIMYIRKKVFVI